MRAKFLFLVLFGVQIFAGSSIAQAADELSGRLFTTAPERAKLDQDRDREREMKRLHRQKNVDGEAETMSPLVDEATLDGYVLRSGGKNTVWINQVEQNIDRGNAGAMRLQVTQRPGKSAEISIQNGNAPPVRLKVGDTLDKNTGAVRDLVEQNR